VVLNGPRADEHANTDLRIGQAVTSHPGDLGLLGGELLNAGGDAALAGRFAGGL
jgi:hypothetical protein